MLRRLALLSALAAAAGCSSAPPGDAPADPAPAAAPAPPAGPPDPPKLPPSIAGEPPAGAIVLDDEDNDGRVQFIGEWYEAQAGRDHGQSCHWTTPDPAGKARIVWSATLPRAGRWHVYLWYGEDPYNDHATDAPFGVAFDGGVKSFRVDLKQRQGTWVPLGTFPFRADKPARVVLMNNANGNVIGDAVLFAPAD